MLKRKFLSPSQKIAIVRAHLIEGIPVSILVDRKPMLSSTTKGKNNYLTKELLSLNESQTPGEPQ